MVSLTPEQGINNKRIGVYGQQHLTLAKRRHSPTVRFPVILPSSNIGKKKEIGTDRKIVELRDEGIVIGREGGVIKNILWHIVEKQKRSPLSSRDKIRTPLYNVSSGNISTKLGG